MKSPVVSGGDDSFCSSIWESEGWEDLEKESGSEDDLGGFADNENLEVDVSDGTASPQDASIMALQELGHRHEEDQKSQKLSGGGSEVKEDVCYQYNVANGSVMPERHSQVQVYPNTIDIEALKVVHDEDLSKGLIMDINDNECDRFHVKSSLRDDESDSCSWSEGTNGHIDQASAQVSRYRLSNPGDFGVACNESGKINPLEDNEEGELGACNQESKKNNSPAMDLPICRTSTDSITSKDLECSEDGNTGDLDINTDAEKSELIAKLAEDSHVGKENTGQIERHTDGGAWLPEHCGRVEAGNKDTIEGFFQENACMPIENSSISGHINTQREDDESHLPQKDSFEKEMHKVDKLQLDNLSEHPLNRQSITKIGHFVIKSEFSFQQMFASCASQSLEKTHKGNFGRLSKPTLHENPSYSRNALRAPETRRTKVGPPPSKPLKGDQYLSSQWSDVKTKYLRGTGLYSKRVEALLLKYLGPDVYNGKRTSRSSQHSTQSSP